MCFVVFRDKINSIRSTCTYPKRKKRSRCEDDLNIYSSFAANKTSLLMYFIFRADVDESCKGKKKCNQFRNEFRTSAWISRVGFLYDENTNKGRASLWYPCCVNFTSSMILFLSGEIKSRVFGIKFDRCVKKLEKQDRSWVYMNNFWIFVLFKMGNWLRMIRKIESFEPSELL